MLKKMHWNEDVLYLSTSAVITLTAYGQVQMVLPVLDKV
jgi:hypothetical protein